MVTAEQIKTVPKRTLVDRLRQVLLFELLGLVLISPPFMWLSDTPFAPALTMMVIISIIATLWNAFYNICFDWADGKLSGRTADKRPVRWRIVHAVGFEIGILSMSLPIVMIFTQLDLLSALIADLGLAAAYVSYAFFFNLAYDHLFPIVPQKHKNKL